MTKNKHINGLLVILITILVVTACQPSSPQKTSNSTLPLTPVKGTTAGNLSKDFTPQPDLKAPTPLSGKATVTGIVVDNKTGKPFKNCFVRLGEVFGQGENQGYALDSAQSPATTTDTKGAFIFKDVPAKAYVFILIDPTNYDHYVVAHEISKRAYVYNADANKILDIGVISVDLSE
jgi:hypothetical protein